MTNDHQILTALICLIGDLLMLFGLYVTYSRIRTKSGTFGTIGFAFIATYFVFQAGHEIFWASLTHQIIADSPVSNLLMHDSIIQQTPLVFVLRNIILLTSITGGVLFSLAIYRSNSYPKIAPSLIIVGTIGGFIWPVHSMFFWIASIFSCTVGYFLIGFHLSKSSEQSAV